MTCALLLQVWMVTKTVRVIARMIQLYTYIVHTVACFLYLPLFGANNSVTGCVSVEGGGGGMVSTALMCVLLYEFR